MKLFKITLTFCSLFILMSFVKKTDDTNACIVKVNSEWGAVCEKCVEYKNNKRVYDDTYTAYLVNKCDEALEIKLAFQEMDGTWRCFPPKVVQPNDTIKGFACKSEKGKYLKWSRKVNDNSVAFPTDEEINEEFKD